MPVSVTLKSFVAALAKQVQDLENATQDVLISRLVRYAYGDQLDILGQLVGLPRTSLTDDVYRSAITLKIYENNSSGSPEEMAEIAKRMSGATAVRYSEVGPGSYRLYFTGGTFPDNFLADLQKLTGAGIRILGVHIGTLRQFKMGDRVNEALLHE